MYLPHLPPVPARHLRQGLGRCLGQEVGRCIVGSRRPLPQRQRSFAGEAVDLDERTKHALGKGREGEGRGGEGGTEELCSNSSVVHNWIRIRPKTCTAPPPHTFCPTCTAPPPTHTFFPTPDSQCKRMGRAVSARFMFHTFPTPDRPSHT